MTNYDGLNSNLRPIDSPAVRSTENRTTGYEFNSQNERDAISATNIQNFSFSTGRGGTLTLGGTANGNGYLSIKNDAGSVIVVGDNHGLTVNDGSIVIKNAGGTTSIDASGVVSTSNFQGVSVSSSGTFTNTGTTFATVPNSSLTTLVLTRTTRVLLFAFSYGWNQGMLYTPASDVQIETKIKENNSGSLTLNNFLSGIISTDLITTYMTPQSVYRQGITSLAAGTYDYSLMFRATGAGTAEIFNYEVGYMVLGT